MNKLKTVKYKNVELTLILKKVYPNKRFNLYTVAKVKNGKIIPLYDETRTLEQVRDFYKMSEKERMASYGISDIYEEE